jgi:hypothetical protein
LGTFVVVLAWIGLALGLGAAVQLLLLLNRALRPLREIKRYTDDILEAAVGIKSNLGGLGEIERTRELAQQLPQLVAPLAKAAEQR